MAQQGSGLPALLSNDLLELQTGSDLAGDGQEHLLQRGQAQLDVGDAQVLPAGLEASQHVRHLALADHDLAIVSAAGMREVRHSICIMRGRCL